MTERGQNVGTATTLRKKKLGLKTSTKTSHVEQMARISSVSYRTGRSRTHWTSLELARPGGQSSNSFVDTLTDWNAFLERCGAVFSLDPQSGKDCGLPTDSYNPICY